jgi:hypothetical protein
MSRFVGFAMVDVSRRRTTLIGLSEQPGKRQLVSVRIGHVEIALFPGGISRSLRIKCTIL